MNDLPQIYLSEQQVAELLGVSKRLLQQHRSTGIGIPYSRIGRKVIYSKTDVVEYVDRHRIIPDQGIRGLIVGAC